MSKYDYISYQKTNLDLVFKNVHHHQDQFLRQTQCVFKGLCLLGYQYGKG